MTLAQWADKYEVDIVRIPTGGYHVKIRQGNAWGQAVCDLYWLQDYVVASSTGSTVWMVPAPLPKRQYQ